MPSFRKIRRRWERRALHHFPWPNKGLVVGSGWPHGVFTRRAGTQTVRRPFLSRRHHTRRVRSVGRKRWTLQESGSRPRDSSRLSAAGPIASLRQFPIAKPHSADLHRAAGLLRMTPRLSLTTRRLNITSRYAPMPSFRTITTRAIWRGWIWDAPLDITIGPYETYNDELFGYKAAFEAYITIRDDKETGRLKMFADHLQRVWKTICPSTRATGIRN